MQNSVKMQRIWTIGHSTRPLEAFLALLETHRIKLLADVRLLPGSRRHPHFNREPLAASLAEHQITYAHFPELGGRRKTRPDSPHTAWRNLSFRGYADHMETEEFGRGIARLTDLTDTTGPAALMCAEAVWWSCHRSLISDYLKARGIEVLHILDPAAQIIEGRLSYEEPKLL